MFYCPFFCIHQFKPSRCTVCQEIKSHPFDFSPCLFRQTPFLSEIKPAPCLKQSPLLATKRMFCIDQIQIKAHFWASDKGL